MNSTTNSGYHPEKMNEPRRCEQCGKLTHNAEIWRHSGIVVPLCNQTWQCNS